MIIRQTFMGNLLIRNSYKWNSSSDIEMSLSTGYWSYNKLLWIILALMADESLAHWPWNYIKFVKWFFFKVIGVQMYKLFPAIDIISSNKWHLRLKSFKKYDLFVIMTAHAVHDLSQQLSLTSICVYLCVVCVCVGLPNKIGRMSDN